MSPESPSLDPAAPADPAGTPDAPSDRRTFVQPIVAKPDSKFFVKRMVIAAVVIAAGLYFLYDGFVAYPAHNARVAAIDAKIAAVGNDVDAKAVLEKQRRDEGNPKSDFDLFLQRIIGFVLVPFGLYLLVKYLGDAKGVLRLENDTLFIPRHPPVPIGSITGVNNVRWDKKGIALFDYRLADGTEGTFRIDDFLHERPPTDAIHDELLAKMPASGTVTL